MTEEQDDTQDLGPTPVEPGDPTDVEADASDAADAGGRDPLAAVRREEEVGTQLRPTAPGQGPGDVPDPSRPRTPSIRGGGGDGSGAGPAPGEQS